MLLISPCKLIDQYIAPFIKKNIHTVTERIKNIWNFVRDRAVRAWTERKNVIEPLKLAPHPEANTYPRQVKRADWPKFLNAAWGLWGKDSEIENWAKAVEPLEKVTALHAATLGTNHAALFRLIGNDATVDALDIRGQTPAYWAAYHGNLKALMVLTNYGADLERDDYRGKFPLRAAAKYGRDDVIHFLDAQGMDLDQKDRRGLTPLMVAAYHLRTSTYHTLRYLGADEKLKDSLGRTAADIFNRRWKERYHHRPFLFRLFSSPEPTTPICKPSIEKRLSEVAMASR